MSDQSSDKQQPTPRTDAIYLPPSGYQSTAEYALYSLCQQLERELAFRNRQYDDLWADIQRERAIPSSTPRTIEAEAGKYPMNGESLLAILRGIADDEAQGVDKDRKRGAAHACQRCIGAVESWLRTTPSATQRTFRQWWDSEEGQALGNTVLMGIAERIWDASREQSDIVQPTVKFADGTQLRGTEIDAPTGDKNEGQP